VEDKYTAGETELTPSVALGIITEFISHSANFHIAALQLLSAVCNANIPKETKDEIRQYMRFVRNFSASGPTTNEALSCLKEIYYQ